MGDLQNEPSLRGQNKKTHVSVGRRRVRRTPPFPLGRCNLQGNIQYNTTTLHTFQLHTYQLHQTIKL